MRLARRTIQTAGAAIAVLMLLISGGVFAYSTRLPIANVPNANTPSPLDHDHSKSSHTNTCDDENDGETNSTICSKSDDNDQKLKFRIIPINGGAGEGKATIRIQGTSVDVRVDIKKASPSTQYRVALISILIPTTTTIFSSTTFSTTTVTTSTTSSNVCSTGSIGLFVTNGIGNGHAKLEATLGSGNYRIGLRLCIDTVPKLGSSPTTLPVVITAQTTSNESDSETQSEGDESSSTQTVRGNHDDENQIEGHVESKTIPAIISITGSGAIIRMMDPRFSVSEEHLKNDGLLISISADNVTGSRVLLVNLTGAPSLDPASHSLTVTFDGNRVSEASSLAQIFNSSPSDPARFIILVTASGTQLLISIPHFSSHTIQIVPSTSAAQSFLAVSGWTIAVLVLAVTCAIAALYMMRKAVKPNSA